MRRARGLLGRAGGEGPLPVFRPEEADEVAGFLGAIGPEAHRGPDAEGTHVDVDALSRSGQGEGNGGDHHDGGWRAAGTDEPVGADVLAQVQNSDARLFRPLGVSAMTAPQFYATHLLAPAATLPHATRDTLVMHMLNDLNRLKAAGDAEEMADEAAQEAEDKAAAMGIKKG